MAEGRPFGLAANQADVRQVAPLALAPQAFSHDVQVFGVAETHDQHARLRRQASHRALHRVGMFAHHLLRHRLRENAVAAVYPAQRKRQARKHLNQRKPHMPPSKKRNRL